MTAVLNTRLILLGAFAILYCNIFQTIKPFGFFVTQIEYKG